MGFMVTCQLIFYRKAFHTVFVFGPIRSLVQIVAGFLNMAVLCKLYSQGPFLYSLTIARQVLW